MQFLIILRKSSLPTTLLGVIRDKGQLQNRDPRAHLYSSHFGNSTQQASTSALAFKDAYCARTKVSHGSVFLVVSVFLHHFCFLLTAFTDRNNNNSPIDLSIYVLFLMQRVVQSISLRQQSRSNQALPTQTSHLQVVIAQLALKKTQHYALIRTELSLTDRRKQHLYLEADILHNYLSTEPQKNRHALTKA